MVMLAVVPSRAARIAGSDTSSFVDVGLRLQTWLSYTENAAPNGSNLPDAVIRRAYLYVSGRLNPRVGYFAHLAGDRIGQSNITAVTGFGTGNGFAIRDAWIEYDLIPGTPAPKARLQVGRMYVPFTRAFGTPTTFALLPIDVPTLQQMTMIPNRHVGRDDGAALWGNIFDGKIQYRVGASDGFTDGGTGDLRKAGRIAWQPWDPEIAWWNLGTNLGDKKVLSIGVGFDNLPNFVAGGVDHRAWTLDAFLDMPVGGGEKGSRSAITLEGAYGDFDQDNTRFTGDYFYVTGGYLFSGTRWGGRQQAYGRYERFALDPNVVIAMPAQDIEWGGGINHYLSGLGPRAKMTLDFTHAKPRYGLETNRGTLQLQVSF